MSKLVRISPEEVLTSVKQEAAVEYLLILPQESEAEILPRPIKKEPVGEVSVPEKRPPTKIRQHSDGKFYCDECPYVGKAKHLLVHHKHIHNQRYKCESCKLKFSYLKTYKTHLIMAKHGEHADEPVTKFDCDKCDRSFATGEYLQKHKKYFHATDQLECDFCSKVFRNKLSLRRHVLTHIKVSCKICGKKLNKSRLNNHLNYYHGNEKFQCDFCGKKEQRRGEIIHHMKVWHLQNRCPVCAQSFKTEVEFLYHKKVHVAKNHWKCLKCFFRTTTKASLDHHVKKAHETNSEQNRVKIYKCKCKNRDSEVDHVKMHIGVNKFKCLQCDYTGGSLQYVAKHVDLMHSDY